MQIKNITIGACLSALLMFVAACTPIVPEKYMTIEAAPVIYPDYAGTTIPVNIAPLAMKSLWHN